MGRKCEWGMGRQEGSILDASMWGLGKEPKGGHGWPGRGGSLYSQWVASVAGEGGVAGGYGRDMVGDRQMGRSEHGTPSLSEPMARG